MRSLIRLAPALLAAGCALSLLAPRGETLPLYAARQGLPCASCHFDPNGGGPRNEFGFAFASKRHSLEPESGEMPWGELDLTNRVGERFPLYFGVNQRFMLLATSSVKNDSLDRVGFYDMESSIHMAFQPHSKLTLVYTRDGFDAGATTKDAYGLFSGLPGNAYFRAGRFRTPFGLRLDDHTVATRNGFLEFVSDPLSPARFLPYDPRKPDMGLEVGAERGAFFGRAAFTNGESWPLVGGSFANSYAQAKTVKLGYRSPAVEGAVSLYDDFRNSQAFSDPLVRQRVTRWGYYGLTHWKQLALLGEVAAGTDQTFGGGRTNLFAGWAELDYAAHRYYNVRARYDHLILDRSTDVAERKAATHERWSLEGEWVPVPFAEVRWTYRHIDHKDPLLEDENQGYIQFHFSY